MFCMYGEEEQSRSAKNAKSQLMRSLLLCAEKASAQQISSPYNFERQILGTLAKEEICQRFNVLFFRAF